MEFRKDGREKEGSLYTRNRPDMNANVESAFAFRASRARSIFEWQDTK